jgi:hypothetical protein
MKHLFRILLLTLVFINQGCDIEQGKENDCGGAADSFPTPFFFEIIDKVTGENLFTNGTYEPDQIEIKNIVNNRDIEFTFIDEDDFNLIMIHSIGLKTETVNAEVIIGNDTIFSLYVDAERVYEACFSYTKYNEIRIDNAEFELDGEAGLYTIKVE